MKRFFPVFLAFVAPIPAAYADATTGLRARSCLIYINYEKIDQNAVPFLQAILPNDRTFHTGVWGFDLFPNSLTNEMEASIGSDHQAGAISEAKFVEKNHKFPDFVADAIMISHCQNAVTFDYLLENLSTGRFSRVGDENFDSRQVFSADTLNANEFCYAGDAEKALRAVQSVPGLAKAGLRTEKIEVPFEFTSCASSEPYYDGDRCVRWESRSVLKTIGACPRD